MALMLKSSDVQQSFGKVMEQALAEDDVIVERYGQPRVAILSYERYQQLVQLEQDNGGVYLDPPQRDDAAQQRGVALAAQIRADVEGKLNASLEEVMAAMRGRG